MILPETPIPQKSLASEEILDELIEAMTALRIEACLSQSQVAAKLGMASRSHIAAIEARKVVPRLDTALRILSLYGRTLGITSILQGNDQVGHLDSAPSLPPLSSANMEVQREM